MVGYSREPPSQPATCLQQPRNWVMNTHYLSSAVTGFNSLLLRKLSGPSIQLFQVSSCQFLSLNKHFSQPPHCVNPRLHHPPNTQCLLSCWRSQESRQSILFPVPRLECTPHAKIRLAGNFTAHLSSILTIHQSLLIVLDFLLHKKGVSCRNLPLVFVPFLFF